MAAQAVRGQINGNRVVTLLVVLGLLLANSLLFYFVIWDLLSPSKPYTVILFFLSGAGQLGYFFLPWFAKEILGPVFRTSADSSHRLREAEAAHGSGFAVTAFMHIGAALCLTAISLWFLQADLFQAELPVTAYISEANCVEIGGKPVRFEGRLICALEDKHETVASNHAVAVPAY